MDFLFIEYRDPIFGLIVLVLAVLVVAVASWAWGVIGPKMAAADIEKIVKKFSSGDGDNSKLGELLSPSELNALASAQAIKGDFTSAAKIYIILISKLDKSEQSVVLTDLGIVYLKAGLLERAKEALLEAIKISPKNSRALTNLAWCYEKLNDFKSALAVLDALNEQGADIKAQIAYIKALRLNSVATEANINEILKLSKDFAPLKRMALELASKSGDGVSDLPALEHCADLCAQDSELASKIAGFSDIFAVKLLNTAQNSGLEARLKSEFECTKCKQSSKAFFYRCAGCKELGTAKISLSVAQNQILT